MTPKISIKQYKHLSPEERFRLILAASGRGDTGERERLVQAGERISLSMADHAPWSQAFSEICLLHYIELLDEAGRYMEMFARSDQDEEDDVDVDQTERWADTTVEELTVEMNEDDREPVGGFNEQFLRIALASGFVLRTKTEGWQLFCERLHLPPFLLWETLPGYQRFRAALKLAQHAAFTEEGFLKWMNESRPAGEPEITRSPILAAGVADASEHVYRERSHYWRG